MIFKDRLFSKFIVTDFYDPRHVLKTVRSLLQIKYFSTRNSNYTYRLELVLLSNSLFISLHSEF